MTWNTYKVDESLWLQCKNLHRCKYFRKVLRNSCLCFSQWSILCPPAWCQTVGRAVTPWPVISAQGAPASVPAACQREKWLRTWKGTGKCGRSGQTTPPHRSDRTELWSSIRKKKKSARVQQSYQETMIFKKKKKKRTREKENPWIRHITVTVNFRTEYLEEKCNNKVFNCDFGSTTFHFLPSLSLSPSLNPILKMYNHWSKEHSKWDTPDLFLSLSPLHLLP